MKTLVANHTTAQQQSSRTPYIHLVFYNADESTNYDFSTDSVAYGNRILLVDHTEEPYNDYAYIMLRDNDRTVPTLKGYHTNIGYGDTYLGTDYYSDSPRLWVKEQRVVSAGGKLYTLLVLEGIWSFFREQLLIGSLTAGEGFAKRYYDPDDADTTIMHSMTIFYCLVEIEQKVDEACGTEIVLYMEATQDDGIIDAYIPGPELNSIPYYSAADLMQQLLAFTKCFIRLRNNETMQILYLLSSDDIDKTYYSDQQPFFYEYVRNDRLLVPNRIVVFAGVDPETSEWPDEATVIAMAGDTGNPSVSTAAQASIDAYMQVTDIHVSAYIQSQSDAQARAEAILYKYEAQQVTGTLIIPHDAALELYDHLQIVDNRSA